jgi:FtsZ-interacting cell division protein ZipA
MFTYLYISAISVAIIIGFSMFYMTPSTSHKNVSGNKESFKSKKANTVITAYVVPRINVFQGYDLLQTLTICNLTYDSSLQVFHKISDNGIRLFTLASASEPGNIDIAALGSASYNGVVLFLELNSLAADARLAVDAFIETLGLITDELSGNVVNANRDEIGDAEYESWKSEADNVCKKVGTLDLFD